MQTCPTCPGYTGGGGSISSCSACAAMPSGAARDQCYATPPCGSGWNGGVGGGGMGGGSSMQKCFYPNATINGAKAGFTVWCLGDYNDCREGSPSGRSIPNAGLSLGAPSTCESGWTGGGEGTGNATCVADCVATTSGMCSATSISDGKRRVCDFKNSKNWGGTACEEFCNPGSGGGGGTGDGGGMGCRDIEAYRTCIGGATTNVRSDSALAMSCAEKHCGGNEGGGDGESCRRGCDDMVGQQKTSPICTMKGYRPPWCTMSVESCKKGCPGGGGVIEPDGCRERAPSLEHVCVKENGKWTWKISERKPEPPKDFCKANPDHEKCKKPEPRPVQVTGTLEEKLAALEKIIAGLDDQVTGLRNDLADAKDAVSEKKDEIRTLKKSKAPRAEISAAQKELKKMKRTASAIVRNGKKLTRELKFREKEYDRLSLQVPPPYRVY